MHAKFGESATVMIQVKNTNNNHKDDKNHNAAKIENIGAKSPKRSKKIGFAMVTLGLVAISAAVLVGPMVTTDAASIGSQSAPVAAAAALEPQSEQAVTEEVFSDPKDAMDALGVQVILSDDLPEGFTLENSKIVNNEWVELIYTHDDGTISLRMAQGSKDLSGIVDGDEISYTVSETVDGIIRGYTGVSEKKLLTGVWTSEGIAYAVVADDAIESELLKQFAENVI